MELIKCIAINHEITSGEIKRIIDDLKFNFKININTLVLPNKEKMIFVYKYEEWESISSTFDEVDIKKLRKLRKMLKKK